MTDAGTVTINTVYAGFKGGILCTVIGLILTIASGWYIIKSYNINGYGGAWVIKTYAAEGTAGKKEKADDAPTVKNTGEDADKDEVRESFIAEGYEGLLAGTKKEEVRYIPAPEKEVSAESTSDEFDFDVSDDSDFDID